MEPAADSVEPPAESNNVDRETATATSQTTRRAYSNEDFNSTFDCKTPKTKRFFTASCFRSHCINCWLNIFPFFCLLPKYKWKQWLVSDILAGLSLGVIQVPQGMGFAATLGLPAYFGLYTSFFPAAIYFLFGTSRHVSVGTVGLITGMTARIVTKHLQDCLVTGQLTGNDSYYCSNANNRPSWLPDENNTVTITQPPQVSVERQEAVIGLVMAMQFTIGLIFIGMYVLRLGIISRFMSHPFISAMQTASAILTSVSQIAPALGYQSPGFYGVWNLPRQLTVLFENIYKTNAADAIVALVTIVIVLIVREYINLRFEKKLKHPIPIEIIAMILGTIISHFAQLHERFGLVITGDTPRGFIAPEVPVLIIHLENTIQFTTRTLFHLKYDFVFDCLGLAIAIYGVAIVLSKILAQRHRYVLDPNEELLAYGLGHFVSSFFHCFPVTQAPPRTLLMESQGAKTQLAGLVSALFVLVVIVAIGPLFYSMPRALLAAVTFTAVVPVLVRNTMDNRFYWATNKWDCLVWWATLISALLLDPFMAIAIGIGTNVLSMGLSSFFVAGFSFCHVKDTEIFVEQFAYHNVICSKDIRVFRFNGNLAFTNTDSFRRQLFKYTVHPYRISRLREKLAVNEQTPQQPSSNNYQENGVEENGIELGNAEEIQNHAKNEHANTEQSRHDGTRSQIANEILPQQTSIGKNTTSTFRSRKLAKRTHRNQTIDLRSNESTQADDILSVRAVIIDCSGITYIDYNGILCLRQLLNDYKEAGIRLLMACCSGSLLNALPASQYSHTFYPSVFDAFLSAGYSNSAIGNTDVSIRL